MTVHFAQDRFRWDPDSDMFRLTEPPRLFGDTPTRVAVHAWRAEHGWQLLYTHGFDDAGQPGLLDLWSRTTGL